MRVVTYYRIEFDTEQRLHGAAKACLALTKLIEELDPGLTVYLQAMNGSDLTIPGYSPRTFVNINDCLGAVLGRGYIPSEWITNAVDGYTTVRCDPFDGPHPTNYLQVTFGPTDPHQETDREHMHNVTDYQPPEDR